MPSVRTIITDLYSNTSKRILGVGTLGTIQRLQCATLSPFFRVVEGAHPIVITAGGAPDFNFNMAASNLGAAKGFYLFFEDSWSTVATLTRPQRIVAGGGYSGCLYSVYDAGGGTYKCVHTARPSGAMSDTFVAGIRGYAAAQGWRLVHEVPTVADANGGAGVNGCVTTFLVTRVSYTVTPKPVVRTVRLRQNAQGYTVRADRWDTPTP